MILPKSNKMTNYEVERLDKLLQSVRDLRLKMKHLNPDAKISITLDTRTWYEFKWLIESCSFYKDGCYTMIANKKSFKIYDVEIICEIS